MRVEKLNSNTDKLSPKGINKVISVEINVNDKLNIDKKIRPGRVFFFRDPPTIRLLKVNLPSGRFVSLRTYSCKRALATSEVG